MMALQKQIQTARYAKYVGRHLQVMVEAYNNSRGQWIGRTSQNKTLNFTASGSGVPRIGSYTQVLVTRSFPNSLVGEWVV
jgi:tRNA-2-methylthio-N6-dimethylallyladenosine synthase